MECCSNLEISKFSLEVYQITYNFNCNLNGSAGTEQLVEAVFSSVLLDEQTALLFSSAPLVLCLGVSTAPLHGSAHLNLLKSRLLSHFLFQEHTQNNTATPELQLSKTIICKQDVDIV